MEYLNNSQSKHCRRFWMASEIKENPFPTLGVIESFAEMLPKKDTEHSWLTYEYVAASLVLHLTFPITDDVQSWNWTKGRLHAIWSNSIIRRLWNMKSFKTHEKGLVTYLIERYSVLYPEISTMLKKAKASS